MAVTLYLYIDLLCTLLYTSFHTTWLSNLSDSVIQQTLIITSFVAGTAQGIEIEDPGLVHRDYIQCNKYYR